MKPDGQRVAEVGYFKAQHEIQVLLPVGTRVTELTKLLDFLTKDVFSKLERGCTQCHSGDHLIIREQLANVIRVDIDQRAIVR